ncbi:MAG: O-antigen ligase family protein [Alphaproteobacteria bacterium]
MPSTHAVTLHVPTPATVARGLLMVFTLLLPIIFDLTVPEVAGDIRWSWNHLFSGLLVLVGLGGLWAAGGPAKLNLKHPAIFAWAALLAVWAAVSMVDAINIDRSIVPLKAMYAQLILMAAVYTLWHPGFTRKLVWMMVLPLGFCAFVGICQFYNWNDPAFALMLTNTFGLGWLGAVWPTNGPINWIVTTYLQSAVPGSTFANKNLAGSYTVMILPLAAYLMVSSRRVWAQGLASFIFGLGCLFLLYSRSRASWVALCAGALMLTAVLALTPAWRKALLARTSAKHMALLVLPAIVMVAVFGGGKSPVQGAHGLDRSVGEQVEALANSSWNEIGGRIAYNLNGLAITKDHWFNGVGLGCFFSIYPAYNDTVISTPTNSYNIMARPQRTHTDLMQAFTEMGVVGGVAYAAVLLTALLMAWSLRTEQAIAKVGLFPLFGGLSLFVISLNALMDFPMQLPTAPAISCMVMGLLAASYMRVYPSRVVGVPSLKLPRVVLPVLAILWGAISGWALWDDYKFREANQILKMAMMRIYAGVNDDETMRLVTLAQDTYAHDPRIQEHVGVVYANYRGSQQMTIEDRIANMEWALARDPWGPNHIINLAGQYLQLAEANQTPAGMAVRDKALARVEDLFGRLQRVGATSYYTWGVGGMLRLLQGRNAEALELMEKAIAIQPDYPPALNGLRIAKERLGIVTPATVVSPSHP